MIFDTEPGRRTAGRRYIRRSNIMWDYSRLQWTREPEKYSIQADRIEITTMPHTDLWQRTYYHFRNDNAPVL